MSNSSSAVPQELLEKIIDNLRNDPASLRKCALASRCLFSRSRRHLFSTIVISSPSRCKRLCDLLKASTYVAKLTQDLKITNALVLVIGLDLQQILCLVTSLRSLIIDLHGFTIQWQRLSEDIRVSIASLLRGRFLKRLSLSSFSHVPSTLLAFEKNMEFLKLGPTFSFIDRLGSDISGMTTSSLEIHLETSPVATFTEHIVQRCALFSEVKVLRLQLFYYHSGMPPLLSILKASARSLETLELRGLFLGIYAVQPPFRFDFATMENLQCLTFNFDLQSLILHPQAGVRRLALRDFLDFISTNSSALQRVSVLKIFLTFHQAAMYAFSLPDTSTAAVCGSLGGPADWAEFDQLLTERRSSHSGPFRVELALEVFEDTEPNLPAAVLLNVIRELMPLAVQSGVLVCEDCWYIRNEQQSVMTY